MFLVLCVRLPVCLQTNSKTYGWILIKNLGHVDNHTWNR